MNRKKKAILGIVALALLLVLAALVYNRLSGSVTPQDNSPGTSQSGRKAAPDFTVQDADGKNVKLSDFSGKPVVVNFWASWCYWCKKEIPDYNTLYRKYSSQGVVFLMVDLVDGQQETKDDGLSFVRQSGYAFPPYFDVSGDAANRYGVSSIPQSVFIDRDGRIALSNPGAMDAAAIEKNIEAILR